MTARQVPRRLSRRAAVQTIRRMSRSSSRPADRRRPALLSEPTANSFFNLANPLRSASKRPLTASVSNPHSCLSRQSRLLECILTSGLATGPMGRSPCSSEKRYVASRSWATMVTGRSSPDQGSPP